MRKHTFPQNFNTRKLGEIKVFFAVPQKPMETFVTICKEIAEESKIKQNPTFLPAEMLSESLRTNLLMISIDF